jgi:lipopolysaccharide/colanic/teichoic acid biosynthesis glycosyltransferase
MSPDCAPGSQLKQGFDLLVAAALLVLLSSLFAVIALLIRCTSGSRVIFRQQRPGWHGEIFTMYKFRTMRPPLPGENPFTTDDVRHLGKVQRQVVIEEAI